MKNEAIQIYETEEVRKGERKKELWERQAGESSRAFTAFAKYRDLGRDRTHAKAAVEIGRSAHLLHKYSLAWNWKERAAAWDDQMDTVKRETILKKIEQMVEYHAGTANVFIECLRVPADIMVEKIKNEPEALNAIKNLDIIALLGVIAKIAPALAPVVDIERKSRGEATQIVDQDIKSDGQRIEVHVVKPIPLPKID